MADELLWRFLAYGAALVAIVWVLRRRGQRAAGVLAALPVLSAPALFTLSFAHDPALAAAAAVAALHATGLTAALVLLFGLARRPLGMPMALVFGTLGALLVAHLTCGVGTDLVSSLASTASIVLAARRYLPRLGGLEGPVCRFLRGYLDGLLVRIAFLTVLATTLAPLGGWLAFALALLAGSTVLIAITADQAGGGAGGVPGGSATTLAERS